MHQMINDVYLGSQGINGCSLFALIIVSVMALYFFTFPVVLGFLMIKRKAWFRSVTCFALPLILIVFAKQSMSYMAITLSLLFSAMVFLAINFYLIFMYFVSTNSNESEMTDLRRFISMIAYSIIYIIILALLHEGQWHRYIHDKVAEIDTGKISYEWKEKDKYNKYVIYKLINDNTDSLVKMEVGNISHMNPFKVLRKNNLKYTTMRWNDNGLANDQSVLILCHVESNELWGKQDVVMTIDTYSHIIKNMNDAQKAVDTPILNGNGSDFEVVKKAIAE